LFSLQDKPLSREFDAEWDWGHAKDYVRMWMILQAEENPSDWVIATGVTTKVSGICTHSFAEAALR
jgi:GDPmannose 4,6-dehydratase